MGNCIPSWFETKTKVPIPVENSYETENPDAIFDLSQSLDTDSENEETLNKK
jgi:hypothetical protein